MKTRQDLKKEFNWILRWTNPQANESGITQPGAYWLERMTDRDERIYIYQYGTMFNQQAYDYIRKTTLPVFRNDLKMYDAHIELFKIMGITKEVK